MYITVRNNDEKFVVNGNNGTRSTIPRPFSMNTIVW